MIVTEFYNGQGLGNQLACYITTRVIALDKGYDFGIMHPERFKGANLFDLDFGKKVTGGRSREGGPAKKLPDGIKHYYMERKITHPESGSDIRMYDYNLINIPDDTKIDGFLQGEQYFEHRKDRIKEWLKIKQENECYDYSDDNTCVINFRGGEYVRQSDFFLDKNYWINAINNMLKINKDFRFIVITDDVCTAKKFFPNYNVFHFSIAKDYVVIKNAYYLILSNSSFAWFPAWLSNDLKYCIAPKYWGRYNISDGYWNLGCNITKKWMYQDKSGNLTDYDTCLEEFKRYINTHKEYFENKEDMTNIYSLSSYKYKENILKSLYKKISKNIPDRFKNKIIAIIKNVFI